MKTTALLSSKKRSALFRVGALILLMTSFVAARHYRSPEDKAKACASMTVQMNIPFPQSTNPPSSTPTLCLILYEPDSRCAHGWNASQSIPFGHRGSGTSHDVSSSILVAHATDQTSVELRQRLNAARHVDLTVVEMFREQLVVLRRLDRQMGAIVNYGEVREKAHQVRQLHQCFHSDKPVLAGYDL